ncbi:unnamed protein product [Cyprideis torosa]|uniref:Uncharacterized protein n=1 Tax=Cyprideis torosa TaxID=163714 RepID=A0A7R8WLC9_9CRUS|nr:unnamed protein product [Cyprideis torosa]CAG0898043.1 unnamed protein product [Cyprideis torosa]
MDSYVVCLFLVAVLVCPLGYGLNPLSLTLQAMDQLLEIKSEDFVGARGYECSQSACRCAKEVKMHCATDGKSFRKFINRCYMICEACTTGVPWHNAQYPWQCDADARHRRSAEELHTDRIVPTMTQPGIAKLQLETFYLVMYVAVMASPTNPSAIWIKLHASSDGKSLQLMLVRVDKSCWPVLTNHAGLC